MKILVTGGAGFIGTNLVGELLKQGHDVVILDDLSTSRPPLLRPGSTLVTGDVCNTVDLDQCFLEGPFQQIYHLACPASPPRYMANPTQTLLTAFCGTHNLIEYARDRMARLLVASTSEVYGEPLHHPQGEDDWSRINTLGPRSCYDAGKAAAESLVAAAWRRHHQSIGMVRIFNTYGPHMDAEDGRVVSNFCCQAIQNKPITIYGDGEQTRSFCFVSDTVDGLIAAMASNERSVWNIGNPAERTIKFMAEKIVALARSKSEIVYKDLPADDPTRRRPDITRAMAGLLWSPTVGLDEGLGMTLDYFRKELRQ